MAAAIGSIFIDGDLKRIYEVPPDSSFTLSGGFRIYVPNDLGTAPEIVLLNVQKDIWSRAVDWWASGHDWTAFPFLRSGGAFRGNDSLGNPKFATNDYTFAWLNGWAFVLADYTHECQFRGNLFSDGSNGELFDIARLTTQPIPRIDGFDSLQTYLVSGSGGFTQTDRDLLTSAENHSKFNGSVYFNSVGVTNGIGTRADPFNVFNDAIDYAESNNITHIHFFNDYTFTRAVKNFQITGVGAGLPVIDLNGQDVGNSRFFQVSLEGLMTGIIIAQECILRSNLELNGNYENCGISGDLLGADGGTILIKDSSSVLAGANSRPTFDMRLNGTCKVVMDGITGGMTIFNCNQITDALSIGMLPASITLDSSCTEGDIVTRGIGKVVDNSVGVSILKEHINIPELVVAIWAVSISIFTDTSTIGGWVCRKLTTLKTLLQAK